MPHRVLPCPFTQRVLHAAFWLAAASSTCAQLSGPTQRAGQAHWSVSMQLQQPRASGWVPQAEPKPWQVHDALTQREQDTARVAIEFRPRSAAADIRELGTVRMQFSSQGSFSLRPRRGGVQMAWKSNF